MLVTDSSLRASVTVVSLALATSVCGLPYPSPPFLGYLTLPISPRFGFVETHVYPRQVDMSLGFP